MTTPANPEVNYWAHADQSVCTSTPLGTPPTPPTGNPADQWFCLEHNQPLQLTIGAVNAEYPNLHGLSVDPNAVITSDGTVSAGSKNKWGPGSGIGGGGSGGA